MTDYKEIGDKLTEAIADFESKLRTRGQIQHASPERFAAIVDHYAESIIDAEFGDKKIENLKTVEDLLMRLVELGKEV